MSPNATLFGQMITFALFVWFTMKYVWPHILTALKEREKKIAAGLAAAERGVHELELAKQRATEYLQEAKQHAADILDQANKRSAQLIDEAKVAANEEGLRLIALAKADIDNQVIAAKQILRQQIASIALLGAEKLLGRTVDAAANEDLLNQLIADLDPTGTHEKQNPVVRSLFD